MTGGCAAAAGGVVGSGLGPGVAGGCASAGVVGSSLGPGVAGGSTEES